ncbi:pilus assembly protein [Azotobacter beijerinckii]|uniref:pilus assembly protein n=1 Tax=Azotobacter beijerinckii TaxID=170623 RepID=UPI002953B8A5|nr:PilC/PilY family type IV pilus protein [Azotobacter beijerinckii]MDV7210383.1 PilC/PilY family type IV pilus protein [Azotobacter beijerinckii]
MKALGLRFFLAVILLTIQLAAQAEDIDLFVAPSLGKTAVPNVLIIVDNTANWNQPFVNEKAALASVLDGLPVDKFRVGMMMFAETGNSNDNTDGSYVRAALRFMSADNKAKYASLVRSFDILDDKGNNPVYGLAMAEAYRYFKAGTAYGGAGKVKRDYKGNTLADKAKSNYSASRAIYALDGNALANSSSKTYVSPISDGCQKNFIIFISNGKMSNNEKDETSEPPRQMLIRAYQDEGGYDEETAIKKSDFIPISPMGETISTANEWALFMKATSSAAVTTYTVDVNPDTTSQQGPAHSALLKSMAAVSDGKYFAVTSDASKIAEALNSIFSEIQSVNSAFASVSLPVSVNAQGTYLNQVFIGMFRPDANAAPLWAGNLKQYRLGYPVDDLKLVDAAGKAAINNSTNFITECARSFWTPTEANSYWGFNPQGECGSAGSSDSPDGSVVEKGGQGYRLRYSNSVRNILTCSPVFSLCDSSTDSLVAFNAANLSITSELLGATSSEEREALINWARGIDVGDEDGDVVTAEVRPSVHGDVVHSRPVAINYGSASSPDVVVFYGGNDGMLHAINGNRTASSQVYAKNDYAAGAEIWSFLPPEFYGKVKRLRRGTPSVSYLGGTGGEPKGYGVDGAITAYMGKAATGDANKTFIYAGMRRGGRVLYAFDVTRPESPTLKWKVGCPSLGSDTGCTTGFSEIGQTWSSATAFTSSAYKDVSGSSVVYKPMLMVGGGYHECEDTDNGANNNTCADVSKGKKIYVLDANTGDLLKTFDTDRGVVADVTIVPDSKGLARYAYTADLGGDIYRITIEDSEPSSWSIKKIASLGCSSMSACPANRKFMFAPEVVVTNSGVNYLQIGSGDREKPLTGYVAATSVSNYFFNIADKPDDTAWLSQGACDSKGTACLDSLLPISTDTPSAEQLVSKPRGWYLALADDEQVVTSAVTLFGDTTFNTHQPIAPSASSCTTLGVNRSYTIPYRDAGRDGERFVVLEGGGLSPSPVSGMVKTDAEDGGAEVPFVCTLDCSEKKPTFTSLSQPKRRVYWNIEQ